jgi:hypothetical protein
VRVWDRRRWRRAARRCRAEQCAQRQGDATITRQQRAVRATVVSPGGNRVGPHAPTFSGQQQEAAWRQPLRRGSPVGVLEQHFRPRSQAQRGDCVPEQLPAIHVWCYPLPGEVLVDDDLLRGEGQKPGGGQRAHDTAQRLRDGRRRAEQLCLEVKPRAELLCAAAEVGGPGLCVEPRKQGRLLV